MVQRKHLPEGEIQRLERLDNSNVLGVELAALTAKDLTVKFHELLVAYRLAARVANRAFAHAAAPSPESEHALALALKDYAPEHFTSVKDERAALLVALYERSESAGVAELRELLFQGIENLEKQAP